MPVANQPLRRADIGIQVLRGARRARRSLLCPLTTAGLKTHRRPVCRAWRRESRWAGVGPATALAAAGTGGCFEVAAPRGIIPKG